MKHCAYSKDIDVNEIQEFFTSMADEIINEDPVDIICILSPKSISYCLSVSMRLIIKQIIPRGNKWIK